MNKVHKIKLAAGIALATAFTLSCSSGDDHDLGNKNRNDAYESKGNNIGNYRTVVIGTQTWMAENLDYDVLGSKCYNNSNSNCEKYGRLYNLETAKAACSSLSGGWHLPSDAEWRILEDYVETNSECCGGIGVKLKARSGWPDTYGGYSNNNGTDDYGFSALPGGYGNSDGSFDDITLGYAHWWGSEVYGNRCIDITGATLSSCSHFESDFLSVRCLKDEGGGDEGGGTSINNLTVFGFSINAGGSFVDLDAGVVFRVTDARYNAANKIDIVYDGSYIYSAFACGEIHSCLNTFLESEAFIISLEGNIAGAVNQVFLNNADPNPNTLASLRRSIYDIADGNSVDRIEAIVGSVFAVVSSESNIFIAKVSSKNGTESIVVAYLGI